ncbi:MAG: diacylglycerol kinase family lipid kinase [Planctomycetota bacterium]|nr:diacylglycerol kinase family lipid kinase [Planctomycetota bacterium]
MANPASGKQRAPEMAEQVLAILKRAGRDVVLRVTTAAGDAGAFAREAAASGAKTVAGCGGDGTLHEIAGALAGTDCALGILPGGRCNDLAHALGMHKKDPVEELAATLLNGATRRIDLGAYRPLGAPEGSPAKHFCTVATLGFDSAVTQYVRTHKFPLKGTTEYLHGVVRVLMKFKPPRVTLKGDFGTYEGRIFLAATGNSSSYGGAMQIAPGAKVDDGVFDCCVVGEVSKLTLLRILPKVFNGGHVSHKAVKMLRTRRLEILTPDGPQDLCADGEVLGPSPAVLEVAAGVLHVKVKNP